jgi:hypothetical protein
MAIGKKTLFHNEKISEKGKPPIGKQMDVLPTLPEELRMHMRRQNEAVAAFFSHKKSVDGDQNIYGPGKFGAFIKKLLEVADLPKIICTEEPDIAARIISNLYIVVHDSGDYSDRLKAARAICSDEVAELARGKNEKLSSNARWAIREVSNQSTDECLLKLALREEPGKKEGIMKYFSEMPALIGKAQKLLAAT